MLTPKQTELLLYVNQRLIEDGVSPSFDEMKEALGLRSKSGIHRLISGLEERGFIRRLPHRARALEVLKLPDQAGIADRYDSSRIRSPEPANDTTPPAPGVVAVPLYGRIAAGTPIEALRDPNTTVGIPPDMLGRGDHYALEVAGDSMVDAGILDGDTVVIQQGASWEPGDIVVALVDREEATLKILKPDGSRIALIPANPRYETRLYEPDRVEVQGRLVGLLRRY